MVTSFGKTLDQLDETETINATDILFIGQLQDDGSYDGYQTTQKNFTKKRVVSKTTSYTVTAEDDVILADASGGAITLNLPTAAGIEGVQKTVVKTDAVANVVIDGYSTETINGSTTKTLTSQYEKVTIISNGTNWIIIG